MRKNTFNLKLITPPADTVITTAEAVLYLRIDNDLENAIVERMIKAATTKLEHYLGMKFMTQTWDAFLDFFPVPNCATPWWDGTREGIVSDLITPQRNIPLPIGPVQSMTEFSTYDDAGTNFAETVGNYVVDTVGDVARVGLKLGSVWPTTILRPNNGIRFRFVCGYATANLVPDDIKQAVLELTAHMYENRGDNEKSNIPNHVMELVRHHRRELIA